MVGQDAITGGYHFLFEQFESKEIRGFFDRISNTVGIWLKLILICDTHYMLHDVLYKLLANWLNFAY